MRLGNPESIIYSRMAEEQAFNAHCLVSVVLNTMALSLHPIHWIILNVHGCVLLQEEGVQWSRDINAHDYKWEDTCSEEVFWAWEGLRIARPGRLRTGNTWLRDWYFLPSIADDVALVGIPSTLVRAGQKRDQIEGAESEMQGKRISDPCYGASQMFQTFDSPER
jgi:hypothetical protein